MPDVEPAHPVVEEATGRPVPTAAGGPARAASEPGTWRTAPAAGAGHGCPAGLLRRSGSGSAPGTHDPPCLGARPGRRGSCHGPDPRAVADRRVPRQTRHVSAEPLERLLSLRLHQTQGQRSPHKPLLALLAIGQLLDSGSSRLPWSVAEQRLADLIADFGPASRTARAQSAAYPFTRLRSDGVWELRRRRPDGQRRSVAGGEPDRLLHPSCGARAAAVAGPRSDDRSGPGHQPLPGVARCRCAGGCRPRP